jgi:hypothetical protein
MILLSMLCLRVAVLPFPPGGDGSSPGELLQYAFAAMMSLLGYGALCAALGTYFRHPVVVGVLIIFGWQQIAQLAPGATHLLTIRSHVTTLMPHGGQSMQRIIEDMASELLNPGVYVTPFTAGVVLTVFSVLMLAIAAAVVREREYTTPVAVTE